MLKNKKIVLKTFIKNSVKYAEDSKTNEQNMYIIRIY